MAAADAKSWHMLRDEDQTTGMALRPGMRIATPSSASAVS